MLALGALLSLLILAGGCRSKVCQQMVECCRQLEDDPKVGKACGRPAEQTGDPKTCRTILKTIGYMFEDRDADPPKACRLET
jgi:hypothetical protein